RHAARRLPGYRDLLESRGVVPGDVRRLEEVPYLDKATVFGGDVGRWVEGGTITGAAELLTSSGTTGGAFSVGVTSRAERSDLERIADAALRGLGASESSPTFLVNCLPMGIGVPTTLATVASPSVHLEMALELITSFGPSFDRVVIVGEPTFLKELAELGREVVGPEWAPAATFMIVGGEWVAESWRSHVGALTGFGRPGKDPASGILLSMGAAELGLHCLVETPELRGARQALRDRGLRKEVFGRDPGYSPSLFSFDPGRLFVEEREHEGGDRTLAVTTLGPRLVPLIRYDLGDLADVVPAETLNEALGRHGSPVRVDGPVVAVWGRAATPHGARWSLRPELVKERLFATPADAACLSGRFHIQDAGTGPRLHVQLRDGAAPRPGLTADLERFLEAASGAVGHVFLHHHREYPFHLPGDYQHKPRYASVRGG
ncbi:MAG: hypothetical protein AB1416_06165, partial [Actinomycetota bacterium]